jgi:predicted RNA-binding protein YlxR (DUF448 family)
MRASVRTCIGCRQRGLASEMARLALLDGQVAVWRESRPPGRGASIHPVGACVAKAVQTGAFARAFRRRVEGVEIATILQQIAAAPGRTAR